MRIRAQRTKVGLEWGRNDRKWIRSHNTSTNAIKLLSQILSQLPSRLRSQLAPRRLGYLVTIEKGKLQGNEVALSKSGNHRNLQALTLWKSGHYSILRALAPSKTGNDRKLRALALWKSGDHSHVGLFALSNSGNYRKLRALALSRNGNYSLLG